MKFHNHIPKPTKNKSFSPSNIGSNEFDTSLTTSIFYEVDAINSWTVRIGLTTCYFDHWINSGTCEKFLTNIANNPQFLWSLLVYLLISSLMTRKMISHQLHKANDFLEFGMIELQIRNLNKDIKVQRLEKIPMKNINIDRIPL